MSNLDPTMLPNIVSGGELFRAIGAAASRCASSSYGLLLAGAGAATYGVVRFTDPQPAYVHVRWSTAVDESARRGLEGKYSLEQPQHTEGLAG